ncbi:LuxR C-terminal-related transcriptional regulator [Streptomyces aureoverticillatus]|uniref:LuxR C-terminal-related transcriptional regulator n=1 Tax=Streptomyces aureoverticillatus TaxID=66871 RepID=UPI0013D9A478|nr:LuxR C-terminal-related transcriptional regulator [Streptomyces aureoverticillatus]QIB48140.1 AAA family ATPase [Streptomyces aureoverticillatus]
MPHDLGAGMLVAKDHEQKQITGAVLAKRGAAVIGPAGVGKTALLSAVTRLLDPARFEVVWTAATEAGSRIPFGVFRGLCCVEAPLDHGRTYGLVRRELGRRAGQRTPVLVIDDVHRLDEWSAALVLSLAADGSLRLVVAARSGLEMSDAVVALWKDKYLERLDLTPLCRADTGRLVCALVNGEAARTTVDLLFRWTGGNPLFVTELVRHARVTRRLQQSCGLWWWRGPLTVPPRLAELFDRELHGLGPVQRDALDAVALGEPLPLPVLEEVAPDVVECLEARGFVRTTESGGQILVRLSGPMLGAAARQRLPLLRRRRLAGALLAASTLPVPQPDQVNRARWQLDAHGPVDADLLTLAAETTYRHDPELACRFARRALDRSSAAAVPLARALVELGDTAQARKVLERARAKATEPDARLSLEIALAEHRCWADRDPARAADELATLRAEAPTPGNLTALDGAHALVLLFGGRTGAAMNVAERVLRRPAHGPGVASARLVLAICRALTGRTKEAVTLAEDAPTGRSCPAHLSELAAVVRDFRVLWPASNASNATGTSNASHVPGVARESAHDHRAGTPGQRHGAESALLGGYLQWLVGHRPEAVALLREAVGQQSGGRRLFRTEASCWLAVCLAEEGEPDAAERVLAGCRSDPVSVVPGQTHWAQAAVAAARGDQMTASASARKAAEAARDAGCWAVEVEYLTYAAWLAPDRPPPGVVDRLALAVRHVDAPRLVAGAEAVLALSRESGAELLDHAVRLDALGMGAQAWRLAESAVAALRREGGHRLGDAVMLVGKLRERLGVAPAAAPSEALTAREVEIASLAAGGLSDRAISDRLALSVRTVESHLARIYRKLGVHSRRDLPAVLGRS